MRWAGKLDLTAGILLGLAIGLVLAYLAIFVVGGGGDASSSSVPAPSPSESRSMSDEPADRASPQPPGQRR